MNKETVLVVEDHEINREIVCKFLEDNYIVLEAENGMEALNIIEHHSEIGVILLDLNMPVMDGFELMHQMYKVRKIIIPVIVLTSQDDIETEEKALYSGAVDFVSKPVNPHILISRVHNAFVRNQMAMLLKMEYLVSHDELTGLYNRSKMFAETQEMISLHKDTSFAFIRFDIDKFRLYNSALGENEGNKLLCYMAKEVERIAKSFPFSTYGRVDADVFCLCEPYNEQMIMKHIRQVQRNLSEYRDDYDIDTSFGIYVIDDNKLNMETIFTRASLAADKCKNLYDTHFAYYKAYMSDSIHEEQEIINEMRTALKEEQFQVYLQPKYNIKSDLPDGAEALVRWMHPEKGMISPAKFIPVFENNGFIADLDYYMWEHVCMIISGWMDKGIKVAPISVNMSRVSLLNPHVTDMLMDLMLKYDIPIEVFNLEVTESAYMSDPDLMAWTIKKLHDAGFVILMDDFGSGYSSLNTLKEIEIDILKLDMKFMSIGGDILKSEKILSSIVRMAGWLGMDVVAEGVETYEQKQFLESIGCGYIQGYYYAKPMPAAEYQQLMLEKNPEFKLDVKEQKSNVPEIFWSADSNIEELISGIDLPLAIIEYTANYAEIIRANKSFIETYGKVSELVGKGSARKTDNAVKEALREAAEEGTLASCNVPFINNGKCNWVRMKAKKIAEIPKSSIICCSFEDTTKEIQYEMRLNRIENILNTNVKKKKMLIVDDSKMSREMLSALFKNEYEILEAGDGAEGLELLKKYHEDIEIVLLDMIMPKMSGREFLQKRNEIAEISSIPVVVISSEDDVEIQVGMLKNGVNDYIIKPFVPEITKQRVKNVLTFKSSFDMLLKEYKNECKKL